MSIKWIMKTVVRFFPLRDKNMYLSFEISQGCFIGNGDYMSNLQAEVWNFSKRNTPPWVFFTFLKLCK